MRRTKNSSSVKKSCLPPFIRTIKGGVVLRFHVVPRSSKTAVCGVHESALKLKVKAPPVDGKANQEIIRFLSKSLGVPKSAIKLSSGASSRQKEFFIEGIGPREVPWTGNTSRVSA